MVQYHTLVGDIKFVFTLTKSTESLLNTLILEAARFICF